MYYSAACQTAFDSPLTRNDVPSRIKSILKIAEQAIVGYEPFFDIRLLVFPEFVHMAPCYSTVKEISKKLAVQIDTELIDPYLKFCKKFGCWIQTGTFLEIDYEYGQDIVFNTTLLIGPNGIELKYRKVHPWIPWEVHSSPYDVGHKGNLFPVADTEIGKIGVAICYDWLFPESIREIAIGGAEIINRVSAYMDPWGAQDPMDWWTVVNRCRALENMVYVVASNQGAQMNQYPPFSWPGGSMIVDYDGRILAQANPGPGECVVVAPIDIEGLRKERVRRLGHDTISHRRGNNFSSYGEPPLNPAIDHPITISSLKKRIESAKKKTGRSGDMNA